MLTLVLFKEALPLIKLVVSNVSIVDALVPFKDAVILLPLLSNNRPLTSNLYHLMGFINLLSLSRKITNSGDIYVSDKVVVDVIKLLLNVIILHSHLYNFVTSACDKTLL